jgi:hypothetical protein
MHMRNRNLYLKDTSPRLGGTVVVTEFHGSPHSKRQLFIYGKDVGRPILITIQHGINGLSTVAASSKRRNPYKIYS